MKKCILLCTVAFLAAIACTYEPVAQEEPETLKKGPIPVTLVVGEPGTRTELVGQNGEIHPWWSKGDGISVIPYPGGGVSEFDVFDFSSDLESASSRASFSGLPNEPGKYFAVYPQRKETYNSRYGYYEYNPEFYDYYNNDEVDFSFTLPTVQHPSLTSFDPDADLLISDPFDINDEDYDEELNKVIVEGVSFTRVNAILKIVLNPQTSRLRGQTVRRVTIGTDAFTSGGDSPEPMNVEVSSTRADVYDSDQEDDSADHGLGGRMYFELYSDHDDQSVNGWESVTAEYTDETYQIGDNGAATYLVTFPGILMNGERYDEEIGSSVFDDGLHIRVETDELVIDRNVVLPPNGIALQPSRVTTLNIKLYDDGVQGTTIQTIGMTLSEESVSLKPGKGMQLEAQFIGITPDSDELEYLVWTSSDDDVVAVEPVFYYYGGGEELRSGGVAYTNLANIRALSEGNATITATYKGKYVATCDVTVEIVPEHPSEMVDLGLPSGTKWAKWNLGATAPEEEGDRYAWGETSIKPSNSWENYKWAAGEKVLKKYTYSAIYSENHQIDNKFLLDFEDDAAYVNWGPDYYTPTQTQWEELIDECEWEEVYADDNYHVLGYRGTGPNGNSIYLPSGIYPSGNYYEGETVTYMIASLPYPSRGDSYQGLYFFNAFFRSPGSHAYYNSNRLEETAYVRPVSGGHRVNPRDKMGAFTLPANGATVSAEFPCFLRESDEIKNTPGYKVECYIYYGTASDLYYGNLSTYSDPGTAGKKLTFSIDDLSANENARVSGQLTGVSGTVFYRAYIHVTIPTGTTGTNSLLIDEWYGETRCVIIP